MSWITFDFGCPDCGHTETIMMRRSEQQETALCPACTGTMRKRPHLNITRVTYVDGNDRFKYAKEKRKLDKMLRQAKKARNADEVARIKSEIGQVQLSSTKDRKAETPVKVSQEKLEKEK